jgi:hypothetical protein
MNYRIIWLLSVCSLLVPGPLDAQDKSIGPSIIITGQYLGESPPLRDLPTITDDEWQEMAKDAEREIRNPELESERSYPFANTALPRGSDPVWQQEMASGRETRAPIMNFNGQDCPYYPPDPNGTVGPNHYMQTINLVYAIYDKTGTLVAGPANLNTLFSGVTGSDCNDGDPIVLYDEQAERWLVGEFSVCGSNDYMLIAVSATNDPTGTWYKYSFDVEDMPDYEKFGIWQDGYYMGTNNSSGNDIYVFQRSQMLIGGTALMVGFDNPWRPGTLGSFMCVPPLDNDGAFAPAGAPGLFITINDDAIGGGSDQLWIYELAVNWTTPASSTFTRSQQLAVAAFDSNFGANQNNIKQLGTTVELDAIPMVIMNPPQYRNFGTYETIVCCHTVDVDNTDHAGIRWYELRRPANGSWSVRQQGTFAPDSHSRWMGSIMLNGNHEIALGYSISSLTIYPGIRYCGQSAAAFNAATGILDVPEVNMQTGLASQIAYNRWGDYSAMQIDPVGDSTFWYTSEYIGTGGARKTKIASFNLDHVLLTAKFSASNTAPLTNTTVRFTDISLGGPLSWSWEITPGTFNYVGGTSASSRNPQVQFTDDGLYTVSLTVFDGTNSDSEIKTDYINVPDCSVITMPFAEDFSDGALPLCWQNIDNVGNGQVWQFNNPGSQVIHTPTAANGFAILDSYHYGLGNSQNADLVSPALDLSAYYTVSISFNHYFAGYPGSSGTLSYSINGGNTWTVIQTWTSSGNGVNWSMDMTSQLAGQPYVQLKWNYTGTYGNFWAIDDVSITGNISELWTGSTSGDWNNGANWSSGSVPSATTMVFIPSTVSNWPVFNGNMTIGSNCGKLTLANGARMTINGNLTISAGKTLAFIANGELNVSGNWTNTGTFIPGSGTVKFTGNTPAAIPTPSNITSYVRSTFTKGMTPLSNPPAGPTGDDGNIVVPVGFTFNYIGTNYDSARISTNGWISLNKSGTIESDNAYLFTSTIPNTTATAWWDDLKTDATGIVSSKTEGNAPFRVFIAEWKSVPTFHSGGNPARISFQVKLFETSNVIEFHYGNLETGNHSNSEGASIGIEDATGGNGHFIEATTGSTTTGVTTLVSTNNWPTVNYRFSPPQATQTFASVIVDKSGSSFSFNTNVVINGNFTITNGTVNGPGLASGILTVGGNWSNNGTYIPGNGTVVFNGTSNQNIGGSITTTFTNLTLNNNAGFTLQQSEKVSGILTMTSGNIDCGSNIIELGTSTSVPGTLARTSGNIAGGFKRWIPASTSTPIDFPLGTASNNHNARITFSNNTGGSLTVKFEPGDPGNNTGFPLTEDSHTINYNDFYIEGSWTLVPASLTSTNYALELTGSGFTSAGTPDETVRILKRPDGGGDWTLQGTHVAGSAPVAKRSGFNGFSRFALGKPCDFPATITAGGPDLVCQSASPMAITLAGAGFGGSASNAAWSVTSLNPANGGNNGILSSNAPTSTPSLITYTPPAGYSGTISLTLTSDDPAGSCSATSGTRTVVAAASSRVSGSFTYYNQANTPIISGISVKLYQDGNQVGTDYTVTAGTYQFTDLCPGTYEIRVSSSNLTEGSVNTTDAAQTNYWGAMPYEIQKVRFYAGDVTGSSFFINSTDALRIQSNFVYGTAFDKGSWSFWRTGETISSNSSPSESYANVTISGSDITANIYGLCAGDFNRSFIPGLKLSASTSLDLIYAGKRQIGKNQEFDLLIQTVNSYSVGAVSLILNFPEELVEVRDVLMNGVGGQLDWTVKNDELRIGWNSPVPLSLVAGAELVTLRLKTSTTFTSGSSIKFSLTPDPLNELADDRYEVIGDAVLSVNVIEASTNGTPGIPSTPYALCFSAYPNPFRSFTTISYTLPFEGKVNLVINNLLGKPLTTLVNETQASGDHVVKFDANTLRAGVYTATLRLKSASNEATRTIKLINTR